MVKLFCALVGVRGSAFSVTIDASEFVGDLKDAIKLKKENDLKAVDADKLQLFLARKGDGTWLDRDGAEAVTLDEHGHPIGFAHMDPLLWIKNPKNFGERFEPNEGEIHVLVVVPPEDVQQKIAWKTTTIDPAASSLPIIGASRPSIWRLDRATIADFGLHCSSDKLILFCRKDVVELFNFFERDVVRDGRCGYVLGPPGSGKSATAAAFALAFATSKPHVVITWIHLSRVDPPMCVRLKGNSKQTVRTLVPLSYLDVSQILNEVDDTKEHIVFLDGVMLNSDREQMICRGWLKENRANRRLVVVTSMSARGKTNVDADAEMNVLEHFVSSWKLNEYFEAVADEELFEIVKPQLDASDDCEPADIDMDASGEALVDITNWRQSLVRSKYYFAGGSARYMFGYPTAEVVSLLETAVDALSNAQSTGTGIVGDRSFGAINRLFCRFRGQRQPGIISQFAGSAIAMFGGPALIKRLASILEEDSNAAMDGWILEMYFFACVRKGGVTLYDGEETIQWPQGNVLVVDPKNLPELPRIGWLKPQKFNQGGYDAIYIDKKQKLVRFVQLTRAHSHTFHIRYFNLFLSALRDSTSTFEVTTLEIFFVIERSVLHDFQFSTITGQGLLAAFPGWNKYEEKYNARCVGIEGVMNGISFSSMSFLCRELDHLLCPL
jgi:Crinkler effector protein N-terminal domain